MFKNVGKPSVVDGSGKKCEVKHAVCIIVGDIYELCSSAVMLKENDFSTEERKITGLLYSESINSFPAYRQRRAFGKRGN